MAATICGFTDASGAGERSAKRDERFFTAIENGHCVAAAAPAARYERRTVYRWKKPVLAAEAGISFQLSSPAAHWLRV